MSTFHTNITISSEPLQLGPWNEYGGIEHTMVQRREACAVLQHPCSAHDEGGKIEDCENVEFLRSR